MVRTALLMALLPLGLPATADVVTVRQIVAYASNRVDGNGPWFIPPGNILDHSPFHRGAWEDWGWTHDMAALTPADANGIVSASLTIRTWGVDAGLEEDPEIDGIYAVRNSPAGSPVRFHTQDGVITLPGTSVGRLERTEAYAWGTTYLTLPPDVIADLYREGSLRLFMNIDEGNFGHRVSLAYSMLTVNFSVPPAPWEPNMPVYQFWSPKTGETFWTAGAKEKEKILTIYPPDTWTYEGVAHYAYRDQRDANVLPVYRFWSRRSAHHFYTMKESEREKLIASCSREVAISEGFPETWIYEGVAFYAPMDGRQSKGAIPVYRFWSDVLGHHCFTTNEAEKQEMEQQPGVWKYEGIAWYTY